MAQMVLPRVQAMVLCDAVEESEQEIGVFHLTGVRTFVDAPFPAVVSQIGVFAHMSGHRGEASCHIEIERVETAEVIFETVPQPVWFDEPTVIVAVLFSLDNCVFPMPGLYYVQIYSERKLIGERPLYLRLEE